MSAPSGSLAEEIRELQQDLKDYKPGKVSKSPDRIEFPENLYIGLFGKTGCGKTSLINSIKYAADGRLRQTKWLQVAPQHKAGGHTMHRKLANITEHIFVIDNRGLDDPSSVQAIEELSAQLDGKRSYDEIVNWQEENDEGADDDPHLETGDAVGLHPIGCAVFVFSALHDLEENTNGLVDVIDYLHIHQGSYPVAVITHIDVAEKTDVEGLITVLRTTGVSDIFKVANLTEDQKKLDEDSQLIILNLIDRCMTDGDETLVFKYYERKGRQRKEAKKQKRKEQEEILLEQERRAEEERRKEKERQEEIERRAEKEQREEKERRAEKEQRQEKERQAEKEEREDKLRRAEDERRAEMFRLESQAKLDQLKLQIELERERTSTSKRESTAVQDGVMFAAMIQDQMVAQERQRMAAQERRRVASLEDALTRMESARQNEPRIDKTEITREIRLCTIQ